jgi:hypothetical protein
MPAPKSAPPSSVYKINEMPSMITISRSIYKLFAVG